jgi:tetratricopeptide (TPR) repeat protein
MQGQSKTLADAFAERARAKGWGRLDGFAFAATMQVAGNRLSWSAPSALAAYVSISFAASHLRGPDNFDIVTRGFEAYRNARYEDAVSAYREALRVNPYDVATQCRLGAAYQKLGDLERARACFRVGFEQDSEIGDHAIKSWCALGVAQTELALGDKAAARQAALRVLALPDFLERHAQADAVLRAADAP